MRRSPDPRRELSYRLFLREIPGPAREGSQGLRVALNIGVSGFIAPAVKASPEMHWTAHRDNPHQLTLDLVNAGTAHSQVIRYELLRDGDGAPFQSAPAAAYALPGSGLRWTIPSRQPLTAGTVLHLKAETDSGPVAADIDLD
jgi:fimbrial chaperone protein